ncbi:MAG: DUF3256 family protein [Prevotella sp.]|nr:DUF3256 family protein [Prevotella sp.]
MTRFIFVLVASFFMTNAFAQRNMRQLWIDMPDSLVEYLNATKRTEMVDFYDMGVRAETTNLLTSATVLDSIADDYAHISLNESAKMQLALLKSSTGDSVICMVRTYIGEAPESVVTFYDGKWRPRDAEKLMAKVETSQLMARPDTMDVEKYERLCSYIDPVMVVADYDPEQQALVLSLSTPLLTNEEMRRVKAILLQRKLKWNGVMFN